MRPPGGRERSVTVQEIIIDCDPGIDDALALAFAAGHPELDLRGITTVAGNVGLDKTTANALRVRDFVGMPDVPVLAGCPRPLLRPPLHARDVHGDSGLGAASIPAAPSGPADGHAVDFLASATAAEPGQITLIAIGPLTNVALALRRYPGLVSQVRNFVIMGGSAGRGNVTPAAEFNIAADPEAAAIVFETGWQGNMGGPDVTPQVRGGGGGYGGGGAGGGDGPPVYDVCALALVAEPGLFGCDPARVDVETAGRFTSGMTVTDFSGPSGSRNALVAMTVDVPAFWDLVLSAYARIPAASPAP